MVSAKVSKIAFCIASCGLVFIGGIHTFVHVTELSGSQLEEAFAHLGDIQIGTDSWPAFALWQGLSFLMGFFAIALGLSNLAGLAGREDALPARGVCVVNIVMMLCVTVIGVYFLGPIQTFGGPFGMVMFSLAALYGSESATVESEASPLR